MFRGLTILGTSLACTLLYWKAPINPDGFRHSPLTLGG
jgi:hypothetical protein